MVKELRRQLRLSQEDFAHTLGESFATIDRRDNGKISPSKLTRTHFKMFCDQKTAQGLLSIERGEK